MAKSFIAQRASTAVREAFVATSAASDFYHDVKQRPNRQQQLHELYIFLIARRNRTLESLTLSALPSASQAGADKLPEDKNFLEHALVNRVYTTEADRLISMATPLSTDEKAV